MVLLTAKNHKGKGESTGPESEYIVKTKSVSIKSVYENEEFLKAQQKVEELQEKEKSLQYQIEQCRNGRTEDAIAAEAKKLLSGKQPNVNVNSDLEILHGELRIVKKALTMAQAEAANVKRQIAFEICKQFEPEATAAALKTIDALENLADAIQAEQDFYTLLRSCGVGRDSMPGYWQVSGWIQRTTGGGSYPFTNPNNPLRQEINRYKGNWKQK